MYSLSIDYLFNRVYDILLWIKYTWFFTILRKDPEVYIEEVAYRDWDGLRDRGWFDSYFALKNNDVPEAEIHISLWQRILESIGIKPIDSDGDGIPNLQDAKPFDADNLSKAEIKERFEEEYSFLDHVRDVFGIGPKDSDGDGVPDSYEEKYGLNKKDQDTDHDGIIDGQELVKGTDPKNPDTDGDLVLDGRDEAPLDSSLSAIGGDADGDGVSDSIERFFGSNLYNKDSDGDSIFDNMDTYILDPENIARINPTDVTSQAERLHFSIQNPVLAFFADIIGILTIVIMIAFVYAACRWFLVFLEGLNHYEHHFEHGEHGSHHGYHVITHHEETKEVSVNGVSGLPTKELTHLSSNDIDNHPKFAVIEGYMHSTSEALWRIGILEADNLLLEALQEKGYQGDGVGEMLKSASFKTVNLAWDAHKIRNRIAHEGSHFELTEREAKRAFSLYESVFRDLKIIK